MKLEIERNETGRFTRQRNTIVYLIPYSLGGRFYTRRFLIKIRYSVLNESYLRREFNKCNARPAGIELACAPYQIQNFTCASHSANKLLQPRNVPTETTISGLNGGTAVHASCMVVASEYIILENHTYLHIEPQFYVLVMNVHGSCSSVNV